MTASRDTPAPQRSVTIIALVGSAHFASHVMQLAVPPLFPLLHDIFGASYVELGMIVTLFYATSGLGQAAAGLFVDRFGAMRILIAGLTLMALSIATMGLVGDYRMLLPLAVVAGLGNSVFHPADLSILSHRVSERMLGRAFAAHGLTGSLGYATAPVLVGTIAAFFSWRAALVAVGSFGLCIAALLYVNRALIDYRRAAPAQMRAGARRYGYLETITTPVVLLAFAYFVITAYGGTGIQTFSVAALGAGYGVKFETATLALTCYLVASAGGTILGGFLADRTTQHHRVAMSGLGLSAGLMLTIVMLPAGSVLPLVALTLAGLANGTTGPSRDVIVRRAAAGAGTGSVFGFVYSGGDFGGATAPLLFGVLGDSGAWRAVFLVCALAYAAAVPTVMQVGRRGAARAAAAAGD